MKYEPRDGSRRGGGVVAAVLLELIKVEQFDTYADLAEALKCRLARARIAYDSARVSEAIRTVELVHRRCLVTSPVPRRRELVEREPDPSTRPMNPAEMARFQAELERRLGQLAVKTMGTATDAAHEAKVRAQAEDFRRRYRAKRLPFVQRLAEIFSGQY